MSNDDYRTRRRIIDGMLNFIKKEQTAKVDFWNKTINLTALLTYIN